MPRDMSWEADTEAGEAAYEAASPPLGLRDECVLVVLTPSNLVTWHPVHPVLLFERHGLDLLAARVVRLSRSRIGRIWADQVPRFHPARWQAAVRLLSAGPSLACLLRRRRSHENSASEEFALLKGPSDPADLQPHHLRWQLGAVNKLNNLLHSADTSARTVRELVIVLGATGARNAWRAAAARGRAASSAVLAAAVQDAEPMVLRPAGASFVHAAVAARARAFECFGPSLAPAERTRIRRSLRDQSAHARQLSPRAGARLLASGAGARFSPPSRAAIADGAAAARVGRCTHLFNVLGDALATLPYEIPVSLRQTMRELELSRWDQIVIESHLAAQHA
jgi:nucleoside diphosphate kinase